MAKMKSSPHTIIRAPADRDTTCPESGREITTNGAEGANNIQAEQIRWNWRRQNHLPTNTLSFGSPFLANCEIHFWYLFLVFIFERTRDTPWPIPILKLGKSLEPNWNWN
jgi:hypothetical protein